MPSSQHTRTSHLGGCAYDSEACGWVYFTLLAAIYPLLLAELVWGMAYLIAKQRTERRVKVSN